MKTILQTISWLYHLVYLLIWGLKSKRIDVSKLGVNSFYNDGRFGSIQGQANEIHNSLKIKYQRCLYVWNDKTQKTPGADINFGHIEKVVQSQPADAKILIVVGGVPSWAANNGPNAYTEMFRQLCMKFKDEPRVEGYQVWNEPDMDSVPDNHQMGFIDSPTTYFNMLGECYKISKMVNPDKIITNAATRSITQDYPNALDYNKKLVNLGIQEIVDVYSIHFYGDQYERLFRPNGVLQFLNSLEKRIWITEGGIEGLDQLSYCSKTFPFLLQKIKKADRIYHYIYHEASDSQIQFGMKVFINGELDVSDLFVWLLNEERL